jgi:hypothetical protein
LTNEMTSAQRDAMLGKLALLRAKLVRQRGDAISCMRECNANVEFLDRRLSDIERSELHLQEMTFGSRT